jgi:hypothetical protein
VSRRRILLPLFYLGDKSGLLGDTAKRISESPARLNLTHHIIGIEDAELVFGFGMSKGGWESVRMKIRD